jgi:hypothetical protein
MAKRDMNDAPIGGVIELRRPEAPAEGLQPATKAPSIAPDVPAAGLATPIAALTQQHQRRRSLRTMLMAAGILVAVVGSAVAWLHGDRYASTDDAYIQAGKLRRMFLVWCRR